MQHIEHRPSQEVQCNLLRRQHEVAPFVAPHHENKDQRMFTRDNCTGRIGRCRAPIDDILPR